jgi:hypothetical protein
MSLFSSDHSDENRAGGPALSEDTSPAANTAAGLGVRQHIVPLECIFYAEFDNELGPVVINQAPGSAEFPAVDILSKTSDYVICPPQLCGRVVALTVGTKKIVGFPLSVEDEKYGRNKFSFNFCFVFRRETDARPWYPIVRKLSTTMLAMEKESEFLFNKDSKKRLKEILTNTRDRLNLQARCVLPLDDANLLSLKLFPILPDPPIVRDHDVPVRVREFNHVETIEWDLAMLQILPYVDGVRYVKKIGMDAGVDIPIVKQCIRQLLYYSCVALVDVFQYSNIYTTGSRVSALLEDDGLAKSCVVYVTKRSKAPPPLAKVFSLYCSMEPSLRVSDFCLTHDTNALHIDDRRFITFGLLHGFIRRVHEYPIFVGSSGDESIGEMQESNTLGAPPGIVNTGGSASPDSNDNHSSREDYEVVIDSLLKLADGVHSMDEICVALLRSRAEVNLLLKSQKFILVNDESRVEGGKREKWEKHPSGFVVQK